MDKKQKLTEKEIITKFSKLLEKTDSETKEKYSGIFYFISSLDAKSVNSFKILHEAWLSAIK